MGLKQRIQSFRENVLPTPLQKSAADNPKRYRWVLLIGMAFILLWQGSILAGGKSISTDPEYRRMGTSGYSYSRAKHFLYFSYYKGIFPMASTRDSLFTAEDLSVAGADKVIEEYPHTLVNEWEHWSRLGEHARVYLMYPSVWVFGHAGKPTIRPFNAAAFLIILLFTWYMFWRYRRPWLGGFIVLLVGSSPYFLVETYRAENIFGLLSMHGLFQLALHLPLFEKKFKWKYLVIPAVAGIVIGTAVHIRGEMLPIILSCFVIYWVNKEFRWFQRLGLSAILVLCYMGTNKIWQAHFDGKWEEAIAFVEEKGGNPYTGSRTGGHMFWHPVFCGLGDYDTEKGYEWKDTLAYRYAVPILKEQYGMDLAYSGQYWLDDYYDEQQWYYKKFDEIPEYEQVMKDKVLGDITSDPWWYTKIVLQRVAGFFTYTSPIHLRFFKFYLPIPWSGWVLLPILFLLWRWRARFELKLLLFTLPLATSSIIIYGAQNSTYSSIYHILLLALVFSWLLEDYMRFRRKKRVATSGDSDPPQADQDLVH